MKKKLPLLIFGLLLGTLLVACGHEHVWQDATCTVPKTCAVCGTTDGVALDHTWQDATCTTPKTCTVCGATDGTVADHAWQDATCITPKTCVECGATDGTVADHAWQDATCTTPKTCAVCGITEGTTLEHVYGEWGEPELNADGFWYRYRSCTLCGDQQAEGAENPSHGSAGYPEGTTLIVSIFADELTTEWDFENGKDRDTRDIMLTHLSSGAAWLTQQIGAYGVEANFIYDWEENSDLYYTYDFGPVLLVQTGGGFYWKQEQYALQNIPAEALKEKYQAQNIIYMFFFNTDEYNTVNSWAVSDRHGEETEIINIYVRDDIPGGFYYMPASSFAHEIMHCFGAPDLYYATSTVPQAYVDHCRAIDSDDIMFSVNMGVTVTKLFTELDAYYLGLVDHCDDVDIWGLGKSSFLD